ncbi:MAG: HTH domain-containing protein, partial [Clostridiales bacterium]|nr:HTH domain-containing protein [Clostridiales bacterium]
MQEKIIEMLLKSDGYLSGQEISDKLGISRQAVWKNINALKQRGYEIESMKNRGYRLASLPSCLNALALAECLNTKVIGKKLIVLDTVGSTNDYLKKLGEEGCPNGTVVAAREQTKGKGRLGSVWQTKKDDGNAYSLLLRPIRA